jgi:hypothetical protein
MKYPNKLIKRGETDKTIVEAIQKRLNDLGYGPLAVDGDFGLETFNVVKLFQSRFMDNQGNALKVDGEIGAITWSVLFGEQSVENSDLSTSPLLKRVLEIASNEVGVREEENNSGLRVKEYLQSVDLPAGNAWCVAFLYFCFDQASQKLGISNPMFKTGGVLRLWQKTDTHRKIIFPKYVDNPSLIKPGFIFVISTGGGFGHAGIVEKVEGAFITTIEGNTNDNGSSNGIGVFRRVRKRKMNTINLGFIDFS